MKLKKLTAFLDNTLKLGDFREDVSNNGLQIEGTEEVKKILFAVDGCQEVFDLAVENDADMIFVHHGLSWGSGMRYFTGINADRFRTLFANGISLYAAHLPLDAHPVYGNNAVLCDMLDLQKRTPFFEYDGVKIGFSGKLPEAVPLKELSAILGENLEVDPLLRGDAGAKIRSVAVVSGGAGVEALFAAKAAGAELLVTGEMEHIMHHVAKELGVSIIALGHYASETTGVLAMQKLIETECGVQTVFAEVPTGL